MRRKTEGRIVYWISDTVDTERDTLFFLHGLTADHTMFEQQIRFFDGCFNVIVWDAPGHGQSGPDREFTYEEGVNGIRKIAEENGIGRMILIGQSLGGFFIQSFLKKYPQMVKAFVSIDSSPYGDYYSRSDLWWIGQVEWMARLYPEKMLKKAIAKKNALTPAGRENMYNMIAGYPKDELCHLMGRGYAEFLKENSAVEISCPVLLLAGEKDCTGKVAAYNKSWAQRTGFPLEWIPGAAHNSNVDQPEIVNKKILQFVQSLGK